MIQFNILSGKKAGTQVGARRFPFRIGRTPGNELQLNDDGVWDQHLILEFNRQDGFTLVAAPNALAAVNGKPVQTALLRSGDIITIGSAKLQFWIAAARQRSLRGREAFVWILLAAVTAVQFALIYWLLR
jgi:pSer/pThr/pTyr-binding forkhead associated (FHA) protein